MAIVQPPAPVKS